MDEKLETQDTDEQMTDGYLTAYWLYYEGVLILADAPPPRDR